MRTCILVLGMHRSGTSALTRVINMLGGQLPKHLLGAQLGNDAGHWEPYKLLSLHDEMLAAAGSNWQDIRPLKLEKLPPALRATFKKRIQMLIADEYGEAPVFLVKDPRICRFVPFFMEALRELGIDVKVALTLRNPLSVGKSLVKRDGMSLSYAKLLWLRHQIDAEVATRDLAPFHIQFEDLLAVPLHWVPLVRQWMQSNGIKSAVSDEEIITSLRGDLLHFKHTSDDLDAASDDTELVRDAYLASVKLGDPDQRDQAQQALNRIKIDFDRTSNLYGGLVADEVSARLRLHEKQAGERERVLGAEIEQARELQRQHSFQTQQEHDRAETLQRQLDAIYHSTSWRVTAPLRGIKNRVLTTNRPANQVEGGNGRPSCIVATTAHALFAAELLERNLRHAGFDVTMVRDRVGDTSRYTHVFAVCPQNFADLPDGYIAFQMEQHVVTRWFTPGYISLLSRASVVLDYSRQNIEYLASVGIPRDKLVFLPLDANPDLLPSQPPEKDIDVLFYGNENCTRRKRILEQLGVRFNLHVVNNLFDQEMRDVIRRSKVVLNIHFSDDGLLETNRIFEALSLGVPVVSEVGSDQDEHQELEPIVDFCPLADLEALSQALARLIDDPEHYKARRQSLFQFVSRDNNPFANSFNRSVRPLLMTA